MLKAIKSFFEQHLVVSSMSGPSKEHTLRLATAALLIEMMGMDDEIQEAEERVLLSLLQSRFSITSVETEQLVDLAKAELIDSTDYYQFTSLINSTFEYSDKIHVIELLWQIAYADKILDKDEEYFVRKISELLYVSHSDFIAAKLRVRGQI